ncbi:OmpA family protein [Puniceibacterium sp. IMCC21224]|uniref:OmpA family protein n=1 Tax=Puniceibacterium sp. IMCC21224 TaxID=1618204 RepID=UPI00064D9A7E|nr:OmpA family protein [Puniceibacterium sp. IMCC21224]KMK65359.1 outer membrane protein/peptidoglycan-associated (lipo)protein [Puniceibacterium sp. IMCC21224]
MIRVKTSLIALTVAALTLSGCVEPQLNSDGTDPNAKAKKGAIIGAVGGAVVGAMTGNDRDERLRNAALGAALGGGGGALIGNQLDRQEAELRQNLGNNVGITNTGDRLIVTLPQDILFDTDSASLRSDLQSDIRSVASSLLSYPNTTVQVIGHTDADGDAGYNLGLSQRRAQSVAGVLISQGVPSSRIQSIGRGEDQPIASNLTSEGKRQNRRVEIVILPNA